MPATGAVFVIVPAVAGVVTLMVNVALAPEARLPTVQVTVPAEFVHPVLAETKVTPAGRVSVTVTPVAGDGPLFLATIVYASGLLVLAVAGAVLVIDRSADTGVLTVVDAEAVLLAVFGSGWSAFTVAVFVIVPAVAGVVTLMVNVALAPLARLATVQVTVPAEFVHPVLAETKVTPAGRVAVTT